jgi:hypothetical protein
MRDLELDATRRKRDLVMRDSQSGYAAQAAILDAELASAIAELNQGPSPALAGPSGVLARAADRARPTAGAPRCAAARSGTVRRPADT